MNHTKHYQILQDESCHWYRIPNNLVEEFEERASIDAWDLTDEEYENFDESKYDKYRTWWSPNEVPEFYENQII